MKHQFQVEGHTSYVNGLVNVRRTETRIIWSFSLGDKKLRAWKTTKVLLAVSSSGGLSKAGRWEKTTLQRDWRR